MLTNTTNTLYLEIYKNKYLEKYFKRRWLRLQVTDILFRQKYFDLDNIPEYKLKLVGMALHNLTSFIPAEYFLTNQTRLRHNIYIVQDLCLSVVCHLIEKFTDY